jgi:hypothetical protein
MIPARSESIRFYYFSEFSIAPSVAFDGNQIPLYFLTLTTNNQPIWGGDISSFAGQVGELRLSGFGNLDNIFFSPEAVPEPAVFGLFALGSLLLGWRFWKR